MKTFFDRAQAVAAAAFLVSMAGPLPLRGAARLERDFHQPPASTWSWAYWWWLDGAASREGITADLEAMKQQGISGALLFDAGVGGPKAPKGPVFMSEAWRELFRHALREADRLKIEVGVNLCSGWNAGGTWVTPEQAAKKLVWSQTTVEGPGEKMLTLGAPPATANFYRDIAVLAMPLRGSESNQIASLELKAGRDYVSGATCRQLAEAPSSDEPSRAAADASCRLDEIQVLTGRLGSEGRLTWQVPAGRWLVLRFGYTLLGSRTKCTSPGSEGYEIDYFNPEAFDYHFSYTARPLLEDAKRVNPTFVRNLLPPAYFLAASFAGGAPLAARPSAARGRVVAAASPVRQTASFDRASAPSGNLL